MPRREKRSGDNNPFEKGENAPRLKKRAEESILDFFEGKSLYCGGTIPKRMLLSDHSVKTLLRNELDDRVFDYIHENCLSRMRPDPEYSDPSVPWSIHFLLQLLYDMQARELPKDYFPGLLLLYFKFCHGIEIPDPPLL